MANFGEDQSGWKHEFQSLQAAHAAVQVKYISLKERHTAKLALLDFHWRRSNDFEAKEVKWKEKEKQWIERVKLLENNMRTKDKDKNRSGLFNEKAALSNANAVLEKLNKDSEKKLKILQDKLNDYKSQVETLEAEKCKLKATNSVLEQQVLNLNEKVASWEDTNNTLLGKIAALEKRTGLKKQLEFKTKRISSLEKDIRVLSNEKTRLAAKNAELLEKCSVLVLKKNNKQFEPKLVTDTEELEDDYLEFERKMQQETLLVTNENLREKLSALEERSRGWKTQLQVNLKKICSLEKDNLVLSNEKISLLAKNAELLEKYSVLEKNNSEFKAKLVMDTEEIEDDYFEFEKKMEEETSLMKSHKELAEFKVKALADHEVLKLELTLKSETICSLEARISQLEKVIDDLNSALNNERMFRQQNAELNFHATNEASTRILSRNDLCKENLALTATLSKKQEEIIRQKEINGLAQLNLIRKDNEIINLIQCNSTISSEKCDLEKRFILITEQLQNFESTYDNLRKIYGKCVTVHGDSAFQFYQFLSNTLCTNFRSFGDYLALIKSSKKLEAEHKLTHESSPPASYTGNLMGTDTTTCSVGAAVPNSRLKVTQGSINAQITSGTPAKPSIIVRKLKRPSDSDRIVKMRKLASDEDEDVNVEV